ncbi:hypothetical protein NSP_24050 [Nodularia spumigena CCY9414]|nr:hypothetical protein NSP_24050 [Nodularia spumigena CCY9414]
MPESVITQGYEGKEAGGKRQGSREQGAGGKTSIKHFFLFFLPLALLAYLAVR